MEMEKEIDFKGLETAMVTQGGLIRVTKQSRSPDFLTNDDNDNGVVASLERGGGQGTSTYKRHGILKGGMTCFVDFNLLSIGSGEGISGCVAAPFDPIEYPENQRRAVRGSPGLLPGRTLRCLTYRSTSRAGLYIHNFVGSCYSSPYRADLSLTAFNAFGAARTEANGGCQYVTVIDQELFSVPA
ncbi:hypothetical protein LXL04_010334 [Taraxacum kok-saghyz]